MPDQASRFSLEGRLLWSRAPSRGIGAEIATVFAGAGADVGIVGRDGEGLEATRQAIAAMGRRCAAIQADLRTVDGPRTAGARSPAHQVTCSRTGTGPGTAGRAGVSASAGLRRQR